MKSTTLDLAVLTSLVLHLNGCNTQRAVRTQPAHHDTVATIAITAQPPGFKSIQNTDSIFGHVLSTDGRALEGVVLFIRNRAIVTNSAGFFRLVSHDSLRTDTVTLTATLIGYDRKSLVVRWGDSVQIKLSPNTLGLNEIVVTGYSTSVRTNRVKNVEGWTLDIPEVSVLSTLQGRVAGVEIIESSNPRKTAQIRLRSGFHGSESTQPLFVVDGVVSRQSIATINPDDIKSIVVLKAAMATALYGSRAANGAILLYSKSRATSRSDSTRRPPRQATSSQSPDHTVDPDSLVPGTLGHNVPLSMRQGRTIPVKAYLFRNRIELRGLTIGGDTITRQADVRVGRYAQILLEANNGDTTSFAIRPSIANRPQRVDSLEAQINSVGHAMWTWNVQPLRSGKNHVLRFVVLSINSTSSSIDTLLVARQDVLVPVDVSYGYMARVFARKAADGLTQYAVLIGIGTTGGIFGLIRHIRKNRKGETNSVAGAKKKKKKKKKK